MPDASDQARAVLAALAHRRRVIVAGAVLAVLAVGAREGVRHRTYTSSATFVLRGARSAPSFAGLASQFGISLPTADAAQSPALYVDVIRSRSVLAAVVGARYCDPCGTTPRPVTLPDALEIDVPRADTGRLTAETVRRLQTRVIGSSFNPKTGIISVSATTGSAALAQQVTARVLSEVTRFNQQSSQSQAGAERRFTEGRLSDVAAELALAEQRLRTFRESNRSFLSPQLALREGQLEREVRRYEEVYSALARSLEQSKIDELRDTPVVMIVDPPSLPDRPDPRGLLLKAVFGGLVGGTVVAAGVVWLTLRDRARVRPAP